VSTSSIDRVRRSPLRQPASAAGTRGVRAS
jgi:hypothetical protein